MKKPYVVVIVPFKGEIDYLTKLVYSLLDSYVSGFSYTITLWDDGSTDDELVKLYDSIPRMVHIIRHKNVGYTQAVWNIINLGKHESHFDYLLICNSDTKMRKGSFHAMVKRMISNNNIFAVGGKILKYDTNTILHTGTRIKNNEIEDPYCGLDVNDPIANKVERRLWVNGCSVLYNLDAMRNSDLNVDFNFTPAYFEEADLMTRANNIGYSCIYEPKAEIDHVMNATMGKEREKYGSIFWGNWEKYLAKWKPQFGSDALAF
jgi:GT2 family glycosyltransferase